LSDLLNDLFSYYRNTLGAFIVFDITNYFSFQNVTKWLDELKQHVSGNLIITLIGNKSDLRHLRAVSREDAQAFAGLNLKLFFLNKN